MNIRKSNITILVLILLTMMILTACSGNTPAEAPTTNVSANETSSTPETKPEAEATAPQSAPAASEEAKPAEATPAETSNNDSGSQKTQTTEEKTEAPAPEPEKPQVAETKPAAEEKPAPEVEKSPTQPTEEASNKSDSTYTGALGGPIAEQPVLLTSSGQSADVQMVKVLLDRANIKYIINPTVKAEEVKDVKTLILAVGGSSKGLGAAGIDADDELERTLAVISKAKELNLKIITLHVGGEARRGELSDKFINACVPKSDYVIVVEEGNKDNLFTKLTQDNGIPMDKVSKITEVLEPLKAAFK